MLLLHPEITFPTGVDITSQLNTALIFTIFMQKKCSHRDNIRAQKKGLSPANPPETISFTISQTQVRWSRAYAEQPEELALLPFPT